MFQIYITRATACFGVTHTRQIYEQALETLPDADARVFGQRFAELETKLGEIDRARSIYIHTSQFADPRQCSEFWRVSHCLFILRVKCAGICFALVQVIVYCKCYRSESQGSVYCAVNI